MDQRRAIQDIKVIGFIYGWGTTFGTKDFLNWTSAFIMIFYYWSINFR
jgi:hypothetical protein